MTDSPKTTNPTDEQILDAIRNGGRTWHLSDRLYMPSRRPYLLRRLKRLEARGLVRRHKQYTAVNDIYWERVP